MDKSLKSRRKIYGVLGAVFGVVGSVLMFNALVNNPSNSEWVIPQNGFGDFEMEASYLTNNELYGNEPVPSFIDDLDWDEYSAYGDDYIVGYDVEKSLVYNGQTRYYPETYFSIISSTGVFLWTYHFEYSEAFAIATTYFDRDDAIEIEHMTLEGDSLFIIFEILNRITYFDPISETDITVDNGNTFDLIGGDSEGENVAQSFVRLDLEDKTFHILGVNEAETHMFDNEDFETVEPFRYALAQEFDNYHQVAFTQEYYGETLTFTEKTNSIALLSEVIIDPISFALTIETIGKWSSTDSIDIDLDLIENTKQERIPIVDSGLMVLDVSLELDDEPRDDLSNNVITAEDDLLSSAQQTFIDNASIRYSEDDQITRLQYHIYGVLDENFNKVTLDILEEIEINNNDNIDAYASIYWIRDNKFVIITDETEYNDDGILVNGRLIIRFQTGMTVTKTRDLSNYGDLHLYEFFMDDEGTILIAGEFGGSETNPIQNYDRAFILLINDQLQIVDDFIIDGNGTACYIESMFIDEGAIRVYLFISDTTDLFVNMDQATYQVLFTIELL